MVRLASRTARACTWTRRTASACWVPTGAGAAEHLGVLDDVDIVMGTFSKSLASVGGFIAGPDTVINYLKHLARPFVFSASLPAASVAAVDAALDVMRDEPERQQRLLAIASSLRNELRSRGFSVLDGITPIVPVVVDSEVDLCRLCKGLVERGHLHQSGAAAGGSQQPAADFLHGGPHGSARGPAGGNDCAGGQTPGHPAGAGVVSKLENR